MHPGTNGYPSANTEILGLFAFGICVSASTHYRVQNLDATEPLAVCGAIFLILEMYQPNFGLIHTSDAALREALVQLGR